MTLFEIFEDSDTLSLAEAPEKLKSIRLTPIQDTGYDFRIFKMILCLLVLACASQLLRALLVAMWYVLVSSARLLESKVNIEVLELCSGGELEGYDGKPSILTFLTAAYTRCKASWVLSLLILR